MTKPMTLEAAVKRLEEIAATMDGDISLDDSLKLYGEATKLIELASERIETAKLQVEKLSSGKTEAESPDAEKPKARSAKAGKTAAGKPAAKGTDDE